MRKVVIALAILSASILLTSCETNPAPVGSASATVTTRSQNTPQNKLL